MRRKSWTSEKDDNRGKQNRRNMIGNKWLTKQETQLNKGIEKDKWEEGEHREEGCRIMGEVNTRGEHVKREGGGQTQEIIEGERK